MAGTRALPESMSRTQPGRPLGDIRTDELVCAYEMRHGLGCGWSAIERALDIPANRLRWAIGHIERKGLGKRKNAKA